MSNDEIERDIAAARAELNGRRDQAVADFDDRLAALEDLANEIAEGRIEERAAQARVRQLVSERGGIAGKAASLRGVRSSASPVSGAVGGNRPPVTAAPTTVRLSASPQMAGAMLSKSLAALDQRIVAIMTDAPNQAPIGQARQELSLLLALRRTLAGHNADLPNDVVLLESIIAFAEESQETVKDLAAGGSQRLRRLLEHLRQTASELFVLGGGSGDVKQEIKRLRASLENSEALASVASASLSLFDRLRSELNARAVTPATTLLDKLLDGR